MRSKSVPEHLVLHLDIMRLARIRGIKEPSAFLTAYGFTDHTAKQYTTGRVQRPDLRDMLKLCRIFSCSLPDLFRLDLPEGKTLDPSDPLAVLVRPSEEPDLHKLLRDMPLKDVHQLARDLASGKKTSSED